MKKVRDSAGIPQFGKIFIPHLAQYLQPLYCLVKRGHVWDWVSEQQASSKKAKILVRQIQAVSISHTGYHLSEMCL